MPDAHEHTTAAEAAAHWWASQLAGPVVHDSGDPSGAGGMAMVLGGLLAAKRHPTEEQIERFREVLVSSIEGEFERCPNLDVLLDVDYHPDRILSDAATVAGIHSSRFPWKHLMWVRPHEVKVKAGYGADPELVWRADA